MLGGRVKTLHPAIHGGQSYHILIFCTRFARVSSGILARKNDSDAADMKRQGYRYVRFVRNNIWRFLYVHVLH